LIHSQARSSMHSHNCELAHACSASVHVPLLGWHHTPRRRHASRCWHHCHFEIGPARADVPLVWFDTVYTHRRALHLFESRSDLHELQGVPLLGAPADDDMPTPQLLRGHTARAEWFPHHGQHLCRVNHGSCVRSAAHPHSLGAHIHADKCRLRPACKQAITQAATFANKPPHLHLHLPLGQDTHASTSSHVSCPGSAFNSLTL
jgi:hypothetical protein